MHCKARDGVAPHSFLSLTNNGTFIYGRRVRSIPLLNIRKITYVFQPHEAVGKFSTASRSSRIGCRHPESHGAIEQASRQRGSLMGIYVYDGKLRSMRVVWD